jgi:hypothetical protein
MSDIDGRRWVLVVYGTPVLLLALVGVAGAGLFVVPGGPCHGTVDLSPPDAEVAVAANGSAVGAVLSGDRALGGETTDRVVVAVRDAESGRTASERWVGAGELLQPGSTLGFTNRSAGFPLTPRDTVTVRWYGVDPGVAAFCPNGRTFVDLARVRVENASTGVVTRAGSVRQSTDRPGE